MAATPPARAQIRRARQRSFSRQSSSVTLPRVVTRLPQIVHAFVREDHAEPEQGLEERDEARRERDEQEENRPRRQFVQPHEMPQPDREDDDRDPERGPLDPSAGSDVADSRGVLHHGGRSELHEGLEPSQASLAPYAIRGPRDSGARKRLNGGFALEPRGFRGGDGPTDGTVHVPTRARNVPEGDDLDRDRNPRGPVRDLLRMDPILPLGQRTARWDSWNFDSSLSSALRLLLRRDVSTIETPGGRNAPTTAIASAREPVPRTRSTAATRAGGRRNARTIVAIPRRGSRACSAILLTSSSEYRRTLVTRERPRAWRTSRTASIART